MKLIKLTSLRSADRAIYINIDHIGHMYRTTEQTSYYSNNSITYTTVGVVTHNNGGFDVKETPEEIIELINQL